MAWGVYANIGATWLASAAYAAAALAAQRRQGRFGRRWGPAAGFLATIAIFLFVAGLRQAAGLVSPAWDLRIFFLNVPIAAAVIVPHAFLVTLVRTGSERRAAQVAFVFGAIVTVGVAAAWVGGATEEPDTAYGTDWALQSDVARVLIIVAILLPGVLGSAWMVALARGLPQGERRRIRLIGWAAFGYFVAFTIDAYGVSGPLFLVLRAVTAGTGVLAWWAYQDEPPAVHTYTPPPDKPGENPFGR